MVSYAMGVLVAVGVVFGLYVAIEVPLTGPMFAQDKLGSHSVDELLKIAVDPKSEDQIEAILQLGKRPGDLAITVPVLAKLTLSYEELVKNAAYSSLQKIGEPAAEHVRQFLDARTMENYKIACSAIRAIGPSCKIYMPEIKELLSRDKVMERKCGLFALQGLEFEALAALDEIIECIDDEDFNNQCSACRILEKLGPDAMEAEEALLKLLDEGNPSTRGWAAVCLGAIGPTTAHPDIANILAARLVARNPIERQRILVGLAYLGPEAKNVAGDVRAQLETRDEFVKAHAAYTLWRITGNTDETLSVLGELMNSVGAAQDSIELLGKMGDKALPLLNSVVRNLDSEEAGTRELAVVAIGNMGPKASSAARQIKELLNDSDALVRIAARESLIALGETPANPESTTTSEPATKPTGDDKSKK